MTDDKLNTINRLLVRSLMTFGKTGEAECHDACRIAAAGYAALRITHPREAERLNGVLHALTRNPTKKEKSDVQRT